MTSFAVPLEGKRVLIVGGAGGGNGSGVTQASQRAGAEAIAIVDIDRSLAEEEAGRVNSAGGRAYAIVADVLEREAIERIVADAVDRMGGIDVLVTVVGGHNKFAPWQPLDVTTDEQWDLSFEINIKYVFRLVRAVVPVFRSQGGGGTIVSIGSVAGVRSSRLAAAYGASKAGLINLARTVSIEYAREKIRMNVISIGLVLTPSARIAPDFEAAIPYGHAGTIEDLGNCAVFFASPLSGYISGQNLDLDGGLTAKQPLEVEPTSPDECR